MVGFNPIYTDIGVVQHQYMTYKFVDKWLGDTIYCTLETWKQFHLVYYYLIVVATIAGSIVFSNTLKPTSTSIGKTATQQQFFSPFCFEIYVIVSNLFFTKEDKPITTTLKRILGFWYTKGERLH